MSASIRSTLAAAPVLFAHAVVTEIETGRIVSPTVREDMFFPYAHVRMHVLKELSLPRASHSGEIALADSRRLRSTLAAAPVLFAHAIVTYIEIGRIVIPSA